MIIKLPKSVRFPITISELLKAPSDNVARLEPLLVYTYRTTITEYPEYGVEVEVERELSSQFDAPIEGKLASWMVKVGTVVHDSKSVSPRNPSLQVLADNRTASRLSRSTSLVRTKSSSPGCALAAERT